jgi:hypothetical protein
MKRHRFWLCAAIVLLIASSTLQARRPASSKDIFQASTDIGAAQPGSTSYDPASQSYAIKGGGADIWGSADDFRFTWKRLSGDASLSADINIAQPATHAFSKGVLMFRQSLDPGSPYADIAIHAGDGHITLQWRATQYGETKDITLPEHNARRLRIERKGDTFIASVVGEGEHSSTAPSITIPMKAPLYVGLGVCSHNSDALQTVTFSQITLN